MRVTHARRSALRIRIPVPPVPDRVKLREAPDLRLIEADAEVEHIRKGRGLPVGVVAQTAHVLVRVVRRAPGEVIHLPPRVVCVPVGDVPLHVRHHDRAPKPPHVTLVS